MGARGLRSSPAVAPRRPDPGPYRETPMQCNKEQPDERVNVGMVVGIDSGSTTGDKTAFSTLVATANSGCPITAELVP